MTKFNKTKYHTSDEDFKTAVANSSSYRQVMLKLGRNPKGGGGYHVTKKRIEALNLDISHFTGQAWNKGRTHIVRPIGEYLNNTRPIPSHRLKLRLIKENYFERKCYECNLTEWNKQPIPIELHHIDNNHLNNSLDNLIILCPNCHALKGRDKSLARDYHAKGFPEFNPIQSSDFSTGCSIYAESASSTNWDTWASKKEPPVCLDCSQSITQGSKRCKSCAGKLQPTKINWPETFKLIEMVNQSSYLAVGRKLGVSDNAVRKRIKNYS